MVNFGGVKVFSVPKTVNSTIPQYTLMMHDSIPTLPNVMQVHMGKSWELINVRACHVAFVIMQDKEMDLKSHEFLSSILSGDPQACAQLDRKSVRVFLSSTAQDTKTDRNYLRQEVVPKLKQLCSEKGLDFRYSRSCNNFSKSDI